MFNGSRGSRRQSGSYTHRVVVAKYFPLQAFAAVRCFPVFNFLTGTKSRKWDAGTGAASKDREHSTRGLQFLCVCIHACRMFFVFGVIFHQRRVVFLSHEGSQTHASVVGRIRAVGSVVKRPGEIIEGCALVSVELRETSRGCLKTADIRNA